MIQIKTLFSYAYLQFDRRKRQADNSKFIKDIEKTMNNNALAYTFEETRLATTGGSDLEHNKYVGQISSIMRFLTTKDGDLSFCFVIRNYGLDLDKSKNKGQLQVEHIFGFCGSFRKITKTLGFHLTFKTTELIDIPFTTLHGDIQITNNHLDLFVSTFIPSAETH